MDKTIYKDMLNDKSSDNLVHCVNFATEHKNELVLEGWSVCILLEGIVDDGEDYYWRLIKPHEGVGLHSCVGRVDPLKGKIDDEVYNHIFNLFKLNYSWWYNEQRRKLEQEYIDRDMRLMESLREMEELLYDKKE